MFQKSVVNSCSEKKFLNKLNILAETHGFEGYFAHQLAVGMSDGDKNKFGVSFAFEYTKLMKQNLLYFTGLRSYFSCSF